MKKPDEHSPNAPAAGWRLLGEFDRPDSGPDGAITPGLLKILAPLALPPDLLDRISQSVQGVLWHAPGPDPTMPEFDSTHWLVFAQNRPADNFQTWGFFWIEKAESISENGQHSARSVELYLYLEGPSSN